MVGGCQQVPSIPLNQTAGERLYAGLLRHVAMPVVQRLQQLPVSSCLAPLEESQWWSLEQLQTWQGLRLRQLVNHAYQRVPLYRRLWQDAGVQPEEVQTVGDLAKLPIVDKKTLRAAYPGRALARDASPGSLVPYQSSGSTGEPLRFVMSRAEKGQRWAVIFRCWAWAGLVPGARYANVMGDHAHGSFQGGFRQRAEQYLTSMLHIPAFAVHDQRIDDVVDSIHRFRPRLLRSYPATAHRLAQAFAQRGIDLPLRGVLTTGEILYPYQRAAIEKQFRCQVFDAYGGDGMDVAFQCGHSSGYHVNAEAVILEVVDEMGKPVLPGHEGRLVLTNLNNYAMPFVRYAIGDLGAWWPSGDVCACGRGLPLLAYVKGRTSDQLVLPDGTALVMWYFTTLFRLTPGIDAFQVRQTAPDTIRFLIVPGDDFGHLPPEGSNGTTSGLHSLGSFVGVDGVMAYLQHCIASQVRGLAKVELYLVDSIPSGPAGKRRFFVADDILES